MSKDAVYLLQLFLSSATPNARTIQMSSIRTFRCFSANHQQQWQSTDLRPVHSLGESTSRDMRQTLPPSGFDDKSFGVVAGPRHTEGAQY
jgi:hypothetical protein